MRCHSPCTLTLVSHAPIPILPLTFPEGFKKKSLFCFPTFGSQYKSNKTQQSVCILCTRIRLNIVNFKSAGGWGGKNGPPFYSWGVVN